MLSSTPRDEIKKILIAFFQQKFNETYGHVNNPGDIDEHELIELKTEKILKKFEEGLITKKIKEDIMRPYWYGVTQSLVGGILLFFLIGIFVLIIQGFTFDFGKLLIHIGEIVPLLTELEISPVYVSYK